MENMCCHENCDVELHHPDTSEHCHQCHQDHKDHLHDKMTGLWYCAFHQAMQEARVEVLKAKILKMWNVKLEKSADAVFETMDIKWRSKLIKEQAKTDLKETLTKIMTEAKSK